MTKLIVNCQTNEITERELNAEEIAQQEIDEANYLAAKAIADAEAEAKAAQRQAILSRLGITEEEARILLGGN
jgi:vacuolar-type H+-ATPase subunit H